MDMETSGLSFKSIFNSICGELGDAKEISKKFSELKTDEDRFKLTYDICRDFISKLNFKRINKSYEKFTELSKVGYSNSTKNQDWEVLKSCNESIAFAPAGSEHLAQAFYKRSLVLNGLSYPKEAEDDCYKALSLVKAGSLKTDIENHKNSLVTGDSKLKNVCFFGNGIIRPLSRGKSTFFDSASKSVGLNCDEKWGRKLIAEEDIKTGEVLIVEKPYSSVLLPSHLYTHCSHCYKRSLNLIPCSGCSFALFCGEDCQRESQDGYHNIECKILDILVGLKVERMELLSLRILIFASQQGKNLQNLYEETKKLHDIKNNCEDCQFYKSSDFINIYNLVTNTSKRTASDLFYRSVISAILIFLLEKYTTFFSVENTESKELLKAFSGGLILRFLQNLPCNAHEVSEFCEDGFDEIGAGAYATLSLINHSCDPNVVRYSCGDAIILRSIKPIKKGDQILDNYGYHYATHPLKDRQAALMKQYYFQCRCEACTQLWPTYEHLASRDLKLKKQTNMDAYKKYTKKFEENLREIIGGNFTSEIIEENMKYLDFLDEFVVLPWEDYNKCQEAIKHCLSFSGNHFRFSRGV